MIELQVLVSLNSEGFLFQSQVKATASVGDLQQSLNFLFRWLQPT